MDLADLAVGNHMAEMAGGIVVVVVIVCVGTEVGAVVQAGVDGRQIDMKDQQEFEQMGWLYHQGLRRCQQK